MTSNILPLKDLPDLSKLLNELHEALDHAMQQYLKQANGIDFKNAINKLGYDLSEITKNIDAWHSVATAPEQYDMVKAIELKIDDVRHLMTKAIGLAKV